jgi:Tol biopolymer transport system component
MSKDVIRAAATLSLFSSLAACAGSSIEAKAPSQIPEQSPFPTYIPTEPPRRTQEPIQIPTLPATRELITTPTLESTSVVPISESKMILFSRNVHGKFDLFRLNLTTGYEENLTNTEDADEMNAQVSPDGTWGVFYGDLETKDNPGGKNILWKIDFKNNNKVSPLTKGIDDNNNVLDQHWYDPTISPDGKTIACKLDKGEENEHGKIYLMDNDGKNIRVLIVKDKDGTLISGQMWKPEFNIDGTKLYITVGEDNDSELYMINIDGTNAIRLTDNNISDWFASQNPTNPDQIAYTSNKSGHDEIYTMNISTGKTERITYESINNDGIEVADPAWSKDGTRITAVENDGEQYDVVIMNKDGNNLRHVTNTTGKGNDELSPFFPQ